MSDTMQDHGYEKPKVERYGDFRELTRTAGWIQSQEESSRS